MITVMGEALMRLSPAPDETTLHAMPGGSALNIAVAVARLGYPAALMARLSRDSYGEILRQYAKSNGVDLSGAPEADEPTAFEIAPERPVPGTRPRLYASYASAGHWSTEDLAWLPPETTVLHVGSLVWSDAPSAAVAARAASRLRKRGALTWLDLRVHPEVVKTPGQCRILLERSVRITDVMVASVTDIGWLYPGRAPQAVAEHWLGLGVAQVFVTSSSGAMVFHGPGSALHWAPPSPASVVNVTSAIDTFTAALLGCVHDCLAQGRDVRNPPASALARALDLATVAAEMTSERPGADSPTAGELKNRLAAIHGTLTGPPKYFCFINAARPTFLVAHAKKREGQVRNVATHGRIRRKVLRYPARLSAVAVSALAAVSFVATGAAPASAAPAAAGSAAGTSASTMASPGSTPAGWVRPTTPPDVPYSLPVQLPSTTSSPAVASDAPYTPAVLNLIAQLEPSTPPTEAELSNASILFHGGTNTTCNNVGPTAAPTGTTPSIMAPCWTDAQGVNTFSGPNAEATTGPTTLMNLASSFDTQLGNVWGQTEGTESRELMVNGLFGPQTDIDRLPNWGRNLTTTGEDPTLSGTMVATQINGIQGAGTLSEMKHFAVYNGQNQNANTEISDQALHQVYLTPYESGFVSAQAAATMCSYQIWQDTSTTLPSSVSSLSSTAPVSPYATAGSSPQTWPLNESHFSCEQPLTLTYALRNLWGSVAMVGSDYPATHSSGAIFQGEAQEQPTTNGYFSDSNSLSTTSGGGFFGPPSAFDATGDTCADASGNAEPCSAAGAVHVAGVPGPGCPATGCTLVQAVANGSVPLSVFNQALAEMLYQEQRFGMLGCNQAPVAASCTNPGGVNGDTSGNALLPTGPARGATPAADLGTKNGDAAVVERESEEGAVLLQNNNATLPITSGDLRGGVLVTGPGAEYTIADPTGEASVGFADRDAISPLEQLKAFTGDSGAFSYVPANAPSGEPVPSSALSDSGTSVTGHLDQTTGPGSPATASSLDFTTASGSGQLSPGDYTWTGYVYVPAADTYKFRFQFSAAIPASDVSFALDGTTQALGKAENVYGNGVTSAHGAALPGTPTDTGYTEAGLTNVVAPAATLTGGSFHQVTITFDNATSGPASFRFAYSRANGDIADAAAAAKGKSLAVVFLNDNGASTTIPNPYGSSPATISAPESLSAASTQLVEAVAAANPNTVVVLNTTNPVLMPWLGSVKSVLEMWFSGEEGGTSTARLLLGLADPSGHTDMSWPASATDTIWGYNETVPLYSGDTPGPHLERLNGGPNGTTDETEGIYNGYRFFDKEGITPLFPFGYGLSYTRFGYSGLHVTRASDGGLDVSVQVTNTGQDKGSAVPQVYLGAPDQQPAGIQFAVRQLAAFDRVTLRPGQSTRVSMHVPLRQLQYWSSASQQWITASGSRTVRVGDADSAASLPLQARVTIPSSGTITCDDTQLSAALVEGNVVVPPGAWCDMIDSTVTGNVTVAGTGLRIANSTIGGSLLALGVRDADDPLSSGANVVCGTTIGRDLIIAGSGKSAPWNLGQCGRNTVKGSVTFHGNQQ